MKANGKNLKMFMYQTHDYMDMYPETIYRTAESLEAVNVIITAFRASWNSGTVSTPKEVSPKEYFQARQSRYWKGYEEELDALACDCTEEWLNEYQSYIESDTMKEMNIKNVVFRNMNRMDDLYFEVTGLKSLLSENPVYEDSITENAGTDKEVCTWVKIYDCGLADFGITYKHDPRHNNEEYTWSSNAAYINSKFGLLGSKYELAAYGCGVREYNPDEHSCYIGMQCTKELAVKIATNNQDKLHYGLDAFIERVSTGAF